MKNQVIPTFPKFDPISLEQYQEYLEFSNQFPPYSDHYFTSAWGWDTDHSVKVSSLNNNLVLQLSDYLTGEPIFTFLGSNQVLETIKTLFAFLAEKNFTRKLEMIPSECLESDLEEIRRRYQTKPDRDNYDYVCQVDDLIEYRGQGRSKPRNKWRAFIKAYAQDVTTVVLPSSDQTAQSVVLKLFTHWKNHADKDQEETDSELAAIKNFFVAAEHLPELEIQVISYQDQPIGFNFFETVAHSYAVLSFQKSDYTYKGINEFSHSQLCKYLAEKGVSYLSLEQDLGIAGLREAKLKYYSFFLEKVIISTQE